MTKRPMIVLASTLLLAGCGFFSRSQTRMFNLDRLPPTTAPSATTAAAAAPIALDDIELPPGFDRREVAVRQQNQQLQVRSAEVWSASLHDLVLHTLAFDLASRLPEGSVILPGAPKPAANVRGINVVFEELAAGPGNVVTLDAHWTLHGAPSRHERLTIDIPSLDSANVATGTSRALAALADRIAGQL